MWRSPHGAAAGSTGDDSRSIGPPYPHAPAPDLVTPPPFRFRPPGWATAQHLAGEHGREGRGGAKKIVFRVLWPLILTLALAHGGWRGLWT